MVIASVPGLNVVEPVTAIAYGMAHKSCVVGGTAIAFILMVTLEVLFGEISGIDRTELMRVSVKTLIPKSNCHWA